MQNGNRYHMVRGSRFYRVRVKPLKPHLPYPACCDSRHKQGNFSAHSTHRLILVAMTVRAEKVSTKLFKSFRTRTWKLRRPSDGDSGAIWIRFTASLVVLIVPAHCASPRCRNRSAVASFVSTALVSRWLSRSTDANKTRERFELYLFSYLIKCLVLRERLFVRRLLKFPTVNYSFLRGKMF